MARRLPQNLKLLRAAFDPKRIRDILPGDSITVDGVEFVCAYLPESTADRFYIVKSPELVARYMELGRQVSGGRIVELGIAEGGSTALLALVAAPEALVAIDLEPQPLDALSAFIEARGLGGTVRPVYGVDQADRERLAAVVRAEAGDGPLDLVIDDCSHQLGPTRTSFEVLFPRLRPGGTYVIEDWNADHLMRDAVAAALRERLAAGDEELRAELRSSLAEATDGPQERSPLLRLALELVLARASSGDAIAEVSVDELWLTVRRGSGALDPDAFRLDDLVRDHFGLTAW